MIKLILMQKPHLFQGTYMLNKNSKYFEGWYFKQYNNNFSISFIPGISLANNSKHSFIQIITSSKSYYISYDISEFKYSHTPFCIKIGNNSFSEREAILNMEDENQNVHISGKLTYDSFSPIKKSILFPNIMGPFSFIPFMECNHAILSMKHKVFGSINFNNTTFKFDNAIGYIEKDWGVSFPKSYVWCQANNFNTTNCSLFFSIADIPFKKLSFNGFICVFTLNGKEYRFATYNNAKIVNFKIKDNSLIITLKKGSYTLNINCNTTIKLNLIAPAKGIMDREIKESTCSTIHVVFKKNNTIILDDTSNNCGVEIIK